MIFPQMTIFPAIEQKPTIKIGLKSILNPENKSKPIKKKLKAKLPEIEREKREEGK